MLEGDLASAFGPVEFHNVPGGPFLQPVWISDLVGQHILILQNLNDAE